MPETMRQVAPYPEALADLAARLRYRQHLGWQVRLEDDLQRDKPGRHAGESRGLTLVVERHGPDSYRPHDFEPRVRHLIEALSEAAGPLPAPVTDAMGPVIEALRDMITVHHYFAVPPSTFDLATWNRWLFDTLGLVDDHERMEDYALAPHPPGGDGPVTRPFAPNHGPGRNPYVVHEYATDEDRRTSFRGDVER